ncbi:hypothetical protein D8674_021348 [Pyrus ussuriensis x Pyrus communis]|uniref:Uncharacterized protein n=1 Tax=Pyrus ussuriensis x Pyrus communis TaxID=2448454 RepID=A0A5N5GNC6_9ROSA|nr:hypothetical protein D8674_021348 [Pyrus ussuriensis x Pyrus communis]
MVVVRSRSDVGVADLMRVTIRAVQAWQFRAGVTGLQGTGVTYYYFKCELQQWGSSLQSDTIPVAW